MKNILIAAVMAACAGTLFAQAPAEKAKPAAEKKPAAAAPAAEPAPAAQPAPAKKPAQPAAAKPAARPQEEPEEAMVMIDTRTEPEDVRGGAAAAAGAGETPAPKGLPSSFGQCKGVISEGGRNILVFENPDDGELTFVQVTFGKGGVSWRYVDALRRFGSEAVSGGMDSDFN